MQPCCGANQNAVVMPVSTAGHVCFFPLLLTLDCIAVNKGALHPPIPVFITTPILSLETLWILTHVLFAAPGRQWAERRVVWVVGR